MIKGPREASQTVRLPILRQASMLTGTFVSTFQIPVMGCSRVKRPKTWHQGKGFIFQVDILDHELTLFRPGGGTCPSRL